MARLRRPTAALTLLGAAILAGLTALVAASGPIAFGELRVEWLLPELDLPRLLGDPDPDQPAAAQTQDGFAVPDYLPAIAVLAASALMALTLRRILAQGPEKETATPATSRGLDADADLPLPVDDVHHVIEETSAQLRRAPACQVGEIVIACWERVEQVAASLGTARRPSQTAAELGVDLLAHRGADDDAVADLLALYHRARFSSLPLPAGAGEHAVRALDTIAAGLR